MCVHVYEIFKYVCVCVNILGWASKHPAHGMSSQARHFSRPYIHIYMRTCIFALFYICLLCVHTCTQALTHTHTHVRTQVCVHSLLYMVMSSWWKTLSLLYLTSNTFGQHVCHTEFVCNP